MSVVSAHRRSVETKASPATCEVRWRVAAAAITAPHVQAWLVQHASGKDKSGDVTLACAVSEANGKPSRATFQIETNGESLVVSESGSAALTRESTVTHIDVFDPATGARLLAATIAEGAPPRLLYAVTNVWATLGVAGGRYEPVSVKTL